MKTYKYRLKDSNMRKRLERMSNSVNYVWNYCNDVSKEDYKRYRNSSKYVKKVTAVSKDSTVVDPDYFKLEQYSDKINTSKTTSMLVESRRLIASRSKAVKDTLGTTAYIDNIDKVVLEELKTRESKYNTNNKTNKKYEESYQWLSDRGLRDFSTGSSALFTNLNSTEKDAKLHYENIPSATVQAICAEFSARKQEAKKVFLKYRSYKKSSPWVPFVNNSIKLDLENGGFTFMGKYYKVYLDRLPDPRADFRMGSFTRDSQGKWFVNFTFKVPAMVPTTSTKEVGLDMGLSENSYAVGSDGYRIKNPKFFYRYQEELKVAQRRHSIKANKAAAKKVKIKKCKLVTKLNKKIKNSRDNFLHNETSKLVKEYGTIFVGNVKSKPLAKTKLAKSINDASWYKFKTMLKYKSLAHGVRYQEVNESYSTQTCSSCLEKTGPRGIENLKVKKWICSNCNVEHDRDNNAGKNILRIGLTGKNIPVKNKSAKE